MTLGVTGGADGWAEIVGLDIAHRTPRSESVPGWIVSSALEPIVTTIATSVHDMLSEIPAGLAEDVVRGKIRLAGGGALLPGLAARIETVAGIGAVLVEDPLRCVVRGAAEILERKNTGIEGAPGLRALTGQALAGPPGGPRLAAWPGLRRLTPAQARSGTPLWVPDRAVVPVALLHRLPGDDRRLAGQQPAATAAKSGMPTRMISRLVTGTLASDPMPSSLLSKE